MKYINDTKIDMMVQLTNLYLSPKVKNELINLHKKYGKWFIYDQKENIKQFNQVVVKSIIDRNDSDTDDFLNEDTHPTVRQKIQRNHLKNYFWDDFKKLEEFNIPKLRDGLRKIIMGTSYTDNAYIDPIILINTSDFRDYFTSRFGMKNVPKDELKMTQKISETFDDIFNLIGEYDAIRLIQLYGTSKDINQLHNTLY